MQGMDSVQYQGMENTYGTANELTKYLEPDLQNILRKFLSLA